MLDQVYVALLHYPCLGRQGQMISTAVTNVDVHDIARTCRTYEIARYYMVTNLAAQQEIIRRVIRYWTVGKGKDYNPNRCKALSYVCLKPYWEEVIEDIQQLTGQKPLIVFTSAKHRENATSFEHMRERIQEENRPILVLFGTGWGLADEVMVQCDYALEPIRARASFNHLSVRSAVSIILERLIGERVPFDENYTGGKEICQTH